MENQFSNPAEQNLSIIPSAKDYITETAKWSKFLSIIGFVFVGFLVLLSIAMMVALPMLNEEIEELSSVSSLFGPILGVVYLAIAGFYLWPVIYLFNFSTKTLEAIKENDDNILADAFKNLKRHYKFMGILTIIILSLYLLLIIAGMLGGMLSML